MRRLDVLSDKTINKRLKRLKRRMKSCKDTRMRDRYQTIYLYLQRYSKQVIATIIGCCLASVCKYIKLYLTLGIKGLKIKHSPGRPAFLADEQKQIIYDVIAYQVPKDVGFPVQMNWTGALVKKWIEQKFGVKYSIRGIFQLLHDLGFTCTRPTYTLAKADAAKQQEFKLIKTPEMKKRLFNGSIDRILFQDESMIRDYQAIHRTWFPRGRQRVFPTYGKHQGVKLIGVLDYGSGEVFCIHATKYDAEVFLYFLQKVLEKYPLQKIIMILDNAKIHHAKLIQPFLLEHIDTLELVFLPPYSPNLNPIEPLWGWLKRTCIYNVFYKSVSEIAQAVQDFLNEINFNLPETIDRLCIKF